MRDVTFVRGCLPSVEKERLDGVCERVHTVQRVDVGLVFAAALVLGTRYLDKAGEIPRGLLRELRGY